MEPADATPTHDPTVLRAIAHPLRSRILSEVAARGTARAADIADELGIPANQASFHLRQLAKYGLVEEAPEAARDRRDRAWRVTSPRGFTVELDESGDPAGDAAAAVLRTQVARRAHGVVDRALTSGGDDRASLVDTAIRLAPDEVGLLMTELREVADRWRERTREDGAATARRTHQLLMVCVPFADPDAAGRHEEP
jgi:DNA-binding transcriptional ArsR family regulator